MIVCWRRKHFSPFQRRYLRVHRIFLHAAIKDECRINLSCLIRGGRKRPNRAVCWFKYRIGEGIPPFPPSAFLFVAVAVNSFYRSKEESDGWMEPGSSVTGARTLVARGMTLLLPDSRHLITTKECRKEQIAYLLQKSLDLLGRMLCFMFSNICVIKKFMLEIYSGISHFLFESIVGYTCSVMI